MIKMYIGALLALVLLGGCSSSVFHSTRGSEHPQRNNTEGQLYYLPKAMLRLKYMPAEAGKASVLTVNMELIKDERQAFRLNYVPNSAFDDDISWKIGTDGMLQEIKSKTKDKSSDIVLKIADIVTQAAKMTIGVPSAKVPVGAKAPPQPSNEVRYFDVLLDPERLEDQSGRDAYLEEAGVRPMISSIIPERPKTEFVAGITGEEKGDGFYYREMLPWKFRIKYNVTETKDNVTTQYFFVQDVSFNMPNASPLAFLGIKRRPFVEAGTTVTFTNGYPTEVKITKPSEAWAVAESPFKLADKGLSLPTSLVQFKFDYSSKNKALYDALKAEIEAKNAYIDVLNKTKGASSGAGD